METSDVISTFPSLVWNVQIEAGLLTADNPDQMVVGVRNGTEEERISVSFNGMFSSFTLQLSKPLW
ncbi:MAG: hypothetical protein ABI887_01795 [Burkholderiales bacterium]